MANQEHVERLKRSVEEWNQWRQEQPNLRPDLSGADLHGINLSRADLSHTHLLNASFNNAILEDTNFIRANLIDTDFTEANLLANDGQTPFLADNGICLDSDETYRLFISLQEQFRSIKDNKSKSGRE